MHKPQINCQMQLYWLWLCVLFNLELHCENGEKPNVNNNLHLRPACAAVLWLYTMLQMLLGNPSDREMQPLCVLTTA